MRKPVILLALLVGGCATAPGYRAPAVEVPSAFREKLTVPPAVVTQPDSLPADSARVAAPEAPTLAEVPAAEGPDAAPDAFWRELGDTTLERLVAELARANLDVRAAEARVREARSARGEAVLDLAPTVTFGGGYTRQRLSSAAFPIGAGSFPDQDIWDAGFDATWELDLFGRLRHNLQAQGAFVEAGREDLRDLRVTLTAELARAYFELRGAQERLAVARRNGENQRSTFQVTRERLDAGRGTAFDTERAQAQLSFTLASIPALEAAVAEAQYRIGVLVGRPPAAVAAELEAPAALPVLPAPTAVAPADSVIPRRPDVAAAERQLAVERALVGAAKADYLPRLSVGAGVGYSATALNRVGDHGTFRYAVGPVITWPALNLGRVKARVGASQAREAEAQARYDQTVLLALQEVETTLSRYRTARARVERIRDAATASARAAELARLRFTGGVADFLQVLDAERTQLDAEDQLAQGRTAAATAYAALYKALGGASAVR
jgi:NodT family efflux transporter outer membrane factor (OMF) lipoprotein